MKKRILGMFLFLSLVFSVHGQAAVIDISAIAAAIENGITMYHQLQTAYNQYQNMVNQLKKLKEDMAAFDVSKYDWKQWDAVLKMTDHYMSQMDNIDNIINRKEMKVGKLRFSMKDLYTTDLYEHLGDEAMTELNPDNISDADKMAFYKKHGLSVKHYNKLRALNQQLHETAVNTAARVEIMEAEDKVVMEQISDFKKATGQTSGTVDSLQLSAKIQAQNLQETKEMSMSIRSLSEQVMQKNMIDITNQETDIQLMNELNRQADVDFSDFYKQGGSDKNLIGPSTAKRRQ